jgi:hypothetical protein
MAITNASRLADFGSGIGTAGAIIQVDNANQRVGIGTTNPQATLQVGTGVTIYGNSGIVSATTFYGSGAGLTGVASTDNINTSTLATFTGGVNISGNSSVSVTGVVTATSFSGTVPSSNLSGALPALDGSALTNLNIPAGFNELDAALFN